MASYSIGLAIDKRFQANNWDLNMFMASIIRAICSYFGWFCNPNYNRVISFPITIYLVRYASEQSQIAF